MDYAFSDSQNRLADDHFDPSFRRAALSVIKLGHLFKHLSWIPRLLQRIPEDTVMKMNSDIKRAIELNTVSDLFRVTED